METLPCQSLLTCPTSVKHRLVVQVQIQKMYYLSHQHRIVCAEHQRALCSMTKPGRAMRSSNS